MLNSLVSVSITTTYKSFGQTFIHDDEILTIVGCIGAITNACGCVFWGHMEDVFSYKVYKKYLKFNV